jgi:toxin ParE1/3/4
VRAEWSDFARDDLDDLVEYFSKDSAFYARQFGENVVIATRRLGDFPESGRRIPEADDDNLREIIVQGYRIMYRFEADTVLILAVMHSRRDLSNPNNQETIIKVIDAMIAKQRVTSALASIDVQA